MTRKAIIYGHPHSGSTILRCMIGASPCVADCAAEAQEAPDVDADWLMSLVKWPLWRKGIIEPDGHAKIFIVRDPAFALYSLRQRFSIDIPDDHAALFAVRYWSDYFDRWIAASEDPCEYAIRYPDIFSVPLLSDLHSFLGVSWGSPYGEYLRSIGDAEMPTSGDIPAPTDHVSYRRHQINQPIRCMDDPGKRHDGPLVGKIAKLKSYKRIFGG